MAAPTGTDQVLPAELLDYGGAEWHVEHPAFGAKGDGTTDDTSAVQSALTHVATNGGTLVFGTGKTYHCPGGLILPFGDNDRTTAATLDGHDCIIQGADGTATGVNGFVSGYLDVNGVATANTTGSETRVASNVRIRNFRFSTFKTPIRLHNFNYGCSLENIFAGSCLNGVELTRCFLLRVHNVILRGTGKAAGGMGFNTADFTNVMGIDRLDCSNYQVGARIVGCDGTVVQSPNISNNGTGLLLDGLNDILTIDTGYIEGNGVGVSVGGVQKNTTLRNTWLYQTTNLESTLAGGQYAVVNFDDVYVGQGDLSGIADNWYGYWRGASTDPHGDCPITSPKYVVQTPARVDIDTSTSGYNAGIMRYDMARPGVNPGLYRGGYSRGVKSTNRAPYQTYTLTSGSYVFTTEMTANEMVSLIWRLKVAHSSGTYQKTFLIFADESANYQAFEMLSTGVVVSSDITVGASAGGFITLTTLAFSSPSLAYSIVRLL